jgi:DNA-binding HxlR family transcriptional regulator
MARPRRSRMLPPEDVHLKAAYKLLGHSSDLRRKVLYALIGRPQRYGELKHLLEGKRDHNLTVALKALQLEGLIDRRMDARREPVVDTYELTPLGIQVVLALQQIRPLHEALERYERARGPTAKA